MDWSITLSICLLSERCGDAVVHFNQKFLLFFFAGDRERQSQTGTEKEDATRHWKTGPNGKRNRCSCLFLLVLLLFHSQSLMSILLSTLKAWKTKVQIINLSSKFTQDCLCSPQTLCVARLRLCKTIYQVLHDKNCLSGLIRSYTIKVHFCQILQEKNLAL